MANLPWDYTSKQAQEDAQLNPTQWDIFLRVTREITNKLREKDPNLKFRDITESVKKDCLENVNKQMVEQGCPEVTRAIVDWRVAKALAISRSHAKKLGKQDSSQSASSAATFYDPIRDKDRLV
ncbi:hypothetical protein COCCADRAFT_112702 [Bipolaris zeicola 26-R-13]|uniref:Uncharacterized protein n=1 Tax=Cochliobolus carbonum (strain 26-R-13) TaxID=930089 RepID=W6XIY6_COCC2|nr:uncharacterized protein COCCADRAFT_112702 [Bipolaris zeicola 26-R-13]EUC27052.1 hypothetical protein COCCADRAFT_112702 [Bipolaris zeicola 26-R-13]